jgi:peptidoglycan/xylan/chitin deacetylase (PgdA/CDA1 family)
MHTVARDRRPVAAVTFDDGPSAWTDAILDELQRHRVTATFFVLGCAVAGHEAVLRRAIALGCEIGVHGYSHRRLTSLPSHMVRDEMRRTIRRVEAATGTRPRLWRAPYLAADNRLRAVCATVGLRQVGVTCNTRDYIASSEEVVSRAVAGLRPGAILLMHDGRAAIDSSEVSQLSRAGTIAALGRILDEASRRGLKIVTISEVMRPYWLWATRRAMARLTWISPAA